MFDCTNYKNCPKNKSFLEGKKYKLKENFNFFFTGCWGVYCRDGEHCTYKYKKNDDGGYKLKIEEEIYGQSSVANCMEKFSKENNVDLVILGGDNVYSDKLDEVSKLIIEEISYDYKYILYDIEKQLRDGFSKCFSNIQTKEYLIAIGNHDIENCDIINKQFNYPTEEQKAQLNINDVKKDAMLELYREFQNDKEYNVPEIQEKENKMKDTAEKWNLPALSYNKIYKMNDFFVNIICIDTNMYETKKGTAKWCEGTYPEDAIYKQKEWVERVLSKNKNVWNIVVGHIPAYCNHHKGDKPIFNEHLFELLKENKDYIHLYLCADEHDQQYIISENLPPQIISGSGGTPLDDPKCEQLVRETKFCEKQFGFVDLKCYKEQIIFNFINSFPENRKLCKMSDQFIIGR